MQVQKSCVVQLNRIFLPVRPAERENVFVNESAHLQEQLHLCIAMEPHLTCHRLQGLVSFSRNQWFHLASEWSMLTRQTQSDAFWVWQQFQLPCKNGKGTAPLITSTVQSWFCQHLKYSTEWATVKPKQSVKPGSKVLEKCLVFAKRNEKWSIATQCGNVTETLPERGNDGKLQIMFWWIYVASTPIVDMHNEKSCWLHPLLDVVRWYLMFHETTQWASRTTRKRTQLQQRHRRCCSCHT